MLHNTCTTTEVREMKSSRGTAFYCQECATLLDFQEAPPVFSVFTIHGDRVMWAPEFDTEEEAREWLYSVGTGWDVWEVPVRVEEVYNY